jgi:hypothetical protein
VGSRTAIARNELATEFVDPPRQRRLDYCLEFSETFGLSKLTAVSSYSVDTSPVHQGWVAYNYQDIQTDLFLKFVESAPLRWVPCYKDGPWIERGNDEFVGEYYFQVYVRQEDDIGDDGRRQRYFVSFALCRQILK